MLAGCELYFGSHDTTTAHLELLRVRWLLPVPRRQLHVGLGRPAPSPASTGSGGYECTSSTDCAAGCYCANGTCEEGGFCAHRRRLRRGLPLRRDRSSCEPDGRRLHGADAECPTGQTCDARPAAARRRASCSTATPSAKAQGFGYCDELTQHLHERHGPGRYLRAATRRDLHHRRRRPARAGERPAIDATAAATASARRLASCADAPVCEHINDETDCLP